MHLRDTRWFKTCLGNLTHHRQLWLYKYKKNECKKIFLTYSYRKKFKVFEFYGVRTKFAQQTDKHDNYSKNISYNFKLPYPLSSCIVISLISLPSLRTFDLNWVGRVRKFCNILITRLHRKLVNTDAALATFNFCL